MKTAYKAGMPAHVWAAFVLFGSPD